MGGGGGGEKAWYRNKKKKKKEKKKKKARYASPLPLFKYLHEFIHIDSKYLLTFSQQMASSKRLSAGSKFYYTILFKRTHTALKILHKKEKKEEEMTD